MLCSCYCVARSYDIDRFEADHRESKQIYRTADAIIYADETIVNGFVCIFSYGCIVLWGHDSQQRERVLAHISTYGIPLRKSPIYDEYTYQLGQKQSVKDDLIVFAADVSLTYQALSVAYALSQSAILSLFEQRIAGTIDQTKHLPDELATRGRTSMSRSALAKHLGQLFKERHKVNLHTDILDTPDFFWENPEYEALYRVSHQDLGIHNRINVLNSRLEIVQELLVLIRDELNSRHSSTLEWIIILLITAEVGLSLMLHVFKVF